VHNIIHEFRKAKTINNLGQKKYLEKCQ